ncbi:3-deoxy-manno-octulosonate cytidylyltransferase [Niallia alba]|uniref:3-deoxy-manno-octulosonate cytidylyltransferase n=1 Tax=Niallia alba TaxID=2729105 RepID=UPI002E2318A5|nr:3-deoxy-manno-octulosonate cytidylyltransferase [Niallia alba]
MKSINILDCTLRDGGYINNWLFGRKQTIQIIDSLIESNIDIIECGYLDTGIDSNINSTRFKSVEEFDLLISEVTIKNDVKFFLMVDYTPLISLDCIPDISETKGYLKGIRMTFHRKNYKEAMDFAKGLLLKGYEVCIQPMVTSSYRDEELLELLSLVNNLEIFAFYIVDSFGTMDNNDIERMYHLVNYNLNPYIRLGFHSHNNKQLAYSNSVKFLNLTNERSAIIDASVYGMGRGAGNLNTEIISEYLNKTNGEKYKIEPLLQIIDNVLKMIKDKFSWGYSIEYFISASKNCHPNYSSFLMNKKTLNVEKIASILDQLPLDKRGSFDKKLIESLYYSNITMIDEKTVLNEDMFLGKNIIIVASGSSIIEYENQIVQYKNNNSTLLIALNHNPKFDVDYYFFSNQKRFDSNKEIVDINKTITTTNIISDINLIYKINNREVFESQIVKNDNVLAVFLQYLINIGVKDIKIAGLDGYNNSENQYSYEEFDRILDDEILKKQNELMFNFLNSVKDKINIRYITPSIYEKLNSKKVLGVIPARYKSSRFPGKPLVKILDIPMIKRTYDRAKLSESLDDLVVATDDIRIEEYCKENNIPVIKTSENCLTGTDRVAEVSRKLDYDLYINIQGDEPLISPEAIDIVIDEFNKHGEKYIAYNLYKEIEVQGEFESPTTIKVIVNENDELEYMSRLPIPFNKSTEKLKSHKQVCVYGFTKKALDIFSSQGKTRNEKFEDIEILRFIDLNYKVKMQKVDFETIAVDTPEDVVKVEEYLINSGKSYETKA